MFSAFEGGCTGAWRIVSQRAYRGTGLSAASHLSVRQTADLAGTTSAWRLNGVPSHVRYVERREKTALGNVQAGLGRSEATCAALIPIKKSQAWWDMTQEERRAVFEDQSRHIADSMKYLPAIARQLYHSRDLGEPFDFLTWFEYAPAHAQMFDDLVGHLRGTEEWRYVEREVDVRLERV